MHRSTGKLEWDSSAGRVVGNWEVDLRLARDPLGIVVFAEEFSKFCSFLSYDSGNLPSQASRTISR
ncbi:MAG TPA: hypothetical protein VFJ47_06170 [Terriglobales bacterium]|nr:hypothetical protein [Terriglobales bacterium]